MLGTLDCNNKPFFYLFFSVKKIQLSLLNGERSLGVSERVNVRKDLHSTSFHFSQQESFFDDLELAVSR